MDVFRLSYLSFRKLANAITIAVSYLVSIGFKRVFVWGKPLSLTIEPTNFCNLHCPECPTGNNTTKRDKGYMSLLAYKKIIDQLSPWLLYHMIYFQGEPFMHPDIFSMIHYAHSKNIYTCTSTNGHFFTNKNAQKVIDSGLDKIIISVDGVTQETYEKYRKGGQLDKVITGIKTLADLKKKHQSHTPQIIIQFLVFRFNEHQIEDIKKLGKSIGADKVELKSAQIDAVKDKAYLLPHHKKYSRYKYERNHITIKNKLKNRCFRIWSTLVITWDGNVIPCCFDKNADYTLGNMHQKNILHLWHSTEFKNCRHQIINHRKSIKMCNNCTSGLRI